MHITHNEALRLFCEVMGVEKSNTNKIITTVDESYLADNHNKTTNSINDTVADVLTHLQENYGQKMPHELLGR